MSLRVTFSNSITFTLMNQYGKGAGIKFESVFRRVYDVAGPRVLRKGCF